MASNLLSRLSRAIQRIEQTIDSIFGRGFPPGLCLADVGPFGHQLEPPKRLGQFSLEDFMKDGFLWAVPKSRRSLEKRYKRKFGHHKYNWKLLEPKTSILMCRTCGHDYEAGRLCGHCYERVKAETKLMQEAIQENLGLNPVEQEVVVLYDGERQQQDEEFWKKQKVVEIPKKRPEWFHQNLLQPTTQKPSDEKEVKPENLA